MLLLFLYAFWIVLNARITADVMLFGIPVAVLIYFFCLRFLHYSFRKDFARLRRVPALAGFLFFLLWKILLSALHVMRLIWSPRRIEPELLRFDPGLRSSAGRMILADAITLTPGTITVEAEPGAFVVHCLDAAAAEGLPESDMLRKIRNLEGGASRG